MDLENFKSPFGGDIILKKKFKIDVINQLYLDKCGLDIKKYFENIEDNEIFQLECRLTGYKFWCPIGISGTEDFYSQASKLWPNYYKTSRWEYDLASKYIKPNSKLLEIGCGRGWFLRRMEKKGVKSVGLEFNAEAITAKVCDSEVYLECIEEHIGRGFKYDVIVTFQVLEHVEDPVSYLRSALSLLNENGKLILSTPNDDFMPHKNYEDAFNFPPHHVGHYNEHTFKNIGNVMGFDIVATHMQGAELNFPGFGSMTEKNIFFKIYRRLSLKIGNILLRYLKEPGHTILCICENKK